MPVELPPCTVRMGRPEQSTLPSQIRASHAALLSKLEQSIMDDDGYTPSGSALHSPFWKNACKVGNE